MARILRALAVLALLALPILVLNFGAWQEKNKQKTLRKAAGTCGKIGGQAEMMELSHAFTCGFWKLNRNYM